MKNIQELNRLTADPIKDDRKYRKNMLIIMAIFFVFFGVWGSFAKLSSAVPASGKITVASNNKVVDNFDGGIVKAIFVKEGQYVTKGQVLVKLDDSKSLLDLKAVESSYYENLAMLNRLSAEKIGANAINFDDELLSANNKEEKEKYINAQKHEFNIRKSDLQSQIAILQSKIIQFQKQSNGISQDIIAKTALSNSYAEKIAALQPLYEERLVDSQQVTDEIRQKINTDGSIATSKENKASIMAQIDELNTQILETKQSFQKDVASKLSDAQTQTADIRSKVNALRAIVTRSEIKSPLDGYVVNLMIHTVGSAIAAGRELMDIVPKGEILIADCMVSSSDIYYVRPDSKVELTFPSFTHIKSLKDIDGIVTGVSADVPDQNGSYYRVQIRLDPSGEKELAKNNLKLVPGMPVEAMIITGDRTLLEYLLDPYKNMLRKGMREQ